MQTPVAKPQETNGDEPKAPWIEAIGVLGVSYGVVELLQYFHPRLLIAFVSASESYLWIPLFLASCWLPILYSMYRPLSDKAWLLIWLSVPSVLVLLLGTLYVLADGNVEVSSFDYRIHWFFVLAIVWTLLLVSSRFGFWRRHGVATWTFAILTFAFCGLSMLSRSGDSERGMARKILNDRGMRFEPDSLKNTLYFRDFEGAELFMKSVRDPRLIIRVLGEESPIESSNERTVAEIFLGIEEIADQKQKIKEAGEFFDLINSLRGESAYDYDGLNSLLSDTEETGGSFTFFGQAIQSGAYWMAAELLRANDYVNPYLGTTETGGSLANLIRLDPYLFVLENVVRSQKPIEEFDQLVEELGDLVRPSVLTRTKAAELGIPIAPQQGQRQCRDDCDWVPQVVESPSLRLLKQFKDGEKECEFPLIHVPVETIEFYRAWSEGTAAEPTVVNAHIPLRGVGISGDRVSNETSLLIQLHRPGVISESERADQGEKIEGALVVADRRDYSFDVFEIAGDHLIFESNARLIGLGAREKTEASPSAWKAEGPNRVLIRADGGALGHDFSWPDVRLFFNDTITVRTDANAPTCLSVRDKNDRLVSSVLLSGSSSGEIETKQLPLMREEGFYDIVLQSVAQNEDVFVILEKKHVELYPGATLQGWPEGELRHEWRADAGSTVEYAIRGDRATFVFVELENLTADLDVELVSETGEQLASSTNGGTEDDSFEAFVEEGEYTLRITSIDEASAYTLSLSGLGEPEELASGQVGPGDARHEFRVDIAGDFTALLGGLEGDADLEVLDGSGAVLGSSTNGDTASESVRLSLEPGTYTAHVYPYEDAVTQYTLSLVRP